MEDPEPKWENKEKQTVDGKTWEQGQKKVKAKNT